VCPPISCPPISAKKSVFNRIVGDSKFELEFADFLDQLDEGEIISFAKNYSQVYFKIEYIDADGKISNYLPDFFVKVNDKNVYIIETKGREDLDDPLKIKRLDQWCGDANDRQSKIKYQMLYVKQDDWEKYKPRNWNELIKVFRGKPLSV